MSVGVVAVGDQKREPELQMVMGCSSGCWRLTLNPWQEPRAPLNYLSRLTLVLSFNCKPCVFFKACRSFAPLFMLISWGFVCFCFAIGSVYVEVSLEVSSDLWQSSYPSLLIAGILSVSRYGGRYGDFRQLSNSSGGQKPSSSHCGVGVSKDTVFTWML